LYRKKIENQVFLNLLNCRNVEKSHNNIINQDNMPNKQGARNTYKYYFKVGKKRVHGGITNDLERREEEHKQKWSNGHIFQIGRQTTKDAAEKWEEEHGF